MHGLCKCFVYIMMVCIGRERERERERERVCERVCYVGALRLGVIDGAKSCTRTIVREFNF